jgi:DUF1680 family protein
MIEIRYSPPDELDLSGTVDELQQLKNAIHHLLLSDETIYVAAAATQIDPHPYQTALAQFEIVKGRGSIHASVIDTKKLQITGSPKSLEVFATYFDFDQESLGGAHNHFEYFAGNDWIDSDSLPLVIGVI